MSNKANIILRTYGLYCNRKDGGNLEPAKIHILSSFQKLVCLFDTKNVFTTIPRKTIPTKLDDKLRGRYYYM